MTRIIFLFSTAQIFIISVLASFGFAQELAPSASRAAWWLARDNVEPIADLRNSAQPGTSPQFQDVIGEFRVTSNDRALEISGDFPEANIWRFDITTFDGQFDMRKLYQQYGTSAYPDDNSILTRRFTKLLGDAEKGRTHTGPWAIFGGKWRVPTARVALDGEHVYTSWFDLPSLEDQQAGRVYASFALDIAKPGRHTIRVSFDDFVYGTRWRMPRWDGDEKPPITYGKNDLRPHHISSIAIGVDERTRMLDPKVRLRNELVGKHQRLDYASPPQVVEGENLSIADVEKMLIHVDFNRGELWEYCVDAESMASANDMDAGKNALAAAQDYDLHVTRLSPAAKKEWDRLFYERMHGLYTFFVFQRNWHPTGYAQNHLSATIVGLIGASLVWDGPEAEKWLRWCAMCCRKRIELYGVDGGLEWMNEARDYGLAYFVRPLELIKYGTGVDLTQNEPFFQNEWRYALHQAPAFPTMHDRKPDLITLDRGMRTRENPNVPLPPSVTPDNTPTDYHFTDVDQVFMRSDWSDDAYRCRLWAGSVFGHRGSAIGTRYNWAHCQVNQGSFVLSKGRDEIILEAGRTRTYRKSAGNNNCILVNDTDQWGAGQVWHPRLERDQLSRIAFFADGDLLCAARADLTNAYPPEARLKSLSRLVVHIKPDQFLVFDRVETDGPGKAEWRFHAAHLEPTSPSSHYTAYSYEAQRALGNRAATYDEAFKKKQDVNCQVGFLTSGVKASLAMTDTYFRWSVFSMPQRHMKVVQQSEAPLTLLTWFGPKFEVQSQGNVYRCKTSQCTWTAIVGRGKSDGLDSNAYFAIAVRDPSTGIVELMRFGGSKIVYQGEEIIGASEDEFIALNTQKAVRRITTIDKR